MRNCFLTCFFLTDDSRQLSIGISPSRHPPGLLSLVATAFTIRLWARFALSAKASLFRRLLSFPTKLCFAGALNCYPLDLWLSRSIIIRYLFFAILHRRYLACFLCQGANKKFSMIPLNHIWHPNLKKWTFFLFYCYHNSETTQYLIIF